MPYIPQINIGGTTYNVKDTEARQQIILENSVISSNVGLAHEKNNLFDTKLSPYKTTEAIVNNNDGTYTVNTTGYGAVQFGGKTMLPAGMYELFGVPEGTAYIGPSTSTSDAYTSNHTNNPKYFLLTEPKECVLFFRTSSAPSSTFIITPYLKKVNPLKKTLENGFDTLINADNVADVSTITFASTAGVTNNNDGTFTWNSGYTGTIFIGGPIILTPGTYAISSVKPAVSEIHDLSNTVIVSNGSDYDKFFTISETAEYYFGIRLLTAQESPFTFAPYVKYISPLFELDGKIASALSASDGMSIIPETRGGFINTAGTTADIYNPNTAASYASTMYYSVIECGEGQPFVVNGAGASAFHSWAFIGTDGETILCKARDSKAAEDEILNAPPGAKYLVITGRIKENRHSYVGKNEALSLQIPSRYFKDQLLGSWMKKISDNAATIRYKSGDTFIWITDPHFSRDNTNNYENGMHSVALIKHICNHLNINKVFCGGDLFSGSVPKYDAVTMLENARDYMSPIWDKVQMIIGNHEYNNPGNIQEQEINEVNFNTLYQILLRDKENQYGSVSPYGDHWIDNEIQKIRYFFINCTKTAGIRTETKEWLFNRFREIPSGYSVVICSHIGISINDDVASIASSFEDVADAMDAVNAKEAFSFGGTTYDYTTLDCKVLFAITGHSHYDASVRTDGGTWIIGTTCDRAAYNGSTEEMKEARPLGGNGEQAFDVVQIDLYSKTVYLTRIGGSLLPTPDRVFTWS